MFFEGALRAAGLGFDYEAFSVRVAEGELPQLLGKLDALPPARIVAMRRAALRVRDYFVYKDMFNPSRDNRAALLSEGRRGQYAFLLLALALEDRARSLGKLPRARPEDTHRHAQMLDTQAADAGVRVAVEEA